jgi:hypothetical protein
MRIFHTEDLATVPPLTAASLYASQSVAATEDRVIPLLHDIFDAVRDLGSRVEGLERRVAEPGAAQLPPPRVLGDMLENVAVERGERGVGASGPDATDDGSNVSASERFVGARSPFFGRSQVMQPSCSQLSA